jgi:hypothetical protein
MLLHHGSARVAFTAALRFFGSSGYGALSIGDARMQAPSSRIAARATTDRNWLPDPGLSPNWFFSRRL